MHAEPTATVVIIQRALRRYRAGFFDALRSDLEHDGIVLRLLHTTPPPAEDPRDDALSLAWAQRIPRRDLRLRGRSVLWQPLTAQSRNADLVVVEQAADLALNYRLLWRQRRHRTRVAFWGHGRSFAEDANATAESMKAWISRYPHWWFAYTDLSARIVADLGYPPERITTVNNAIDTRALARDLAALDDDHAQRLRGTLGLGHGPVGIFLGTLRDDKRLDVLLDAADLIHDRHPDFRLLVVGSGPATEDVTRRTEGRPWIRPVGSRYGAARAELLAVSDLMLVPGWVGLVVLDSFVAGTPLVTAADVPHGPEIEYLRHDGNGLLVDGGSDPVRFAEAVADLLDRPEHLEQLREGCRRDAAHYSVEDMTERFANGIRRALAAPDIGTLGVGPESGYRRHRRR